MYVAFAFAYSCRHVKRRGIWTVGVHRSNEVVVLNFLLGSKDFVAYLMSLGRLMVETLGSFW